MKKDNIIILLNVFIFSGMILLLNLISCAIFFFEVKTIFLENFLFLFGMLQLTISQIKYPLLAKWLEKKTRGRKKFSDNFLSSFVRHPASGGLILILIGVIFFSLRNFTDHLLYASLFFSLTPIIFIIKINIKEESYMVERNKRESKKYFKKVPCRWIPYII